MTGGNARSQSLLAFDMGTATGYTAKRHGTSALVERQGSHVPADTEAAQVGSTATPAAAPARVQPDLPPLSRGCGAICQ